MTSWARRAAPARAPSSRATSCSRACRRPTSPSRRWRPRPSWT
ncbi:hypothetical protein RLOC_00006454, partial [Lonchura striata]